MKVHLSLTEKRMLTLLCQGHAPKQIAPMLNIAYGTWKMYITIVRIKLRAKTTNQAVAIAVHSRLISFDGEDMPHFTEG